MVDLFSQVRPAVLIEGMSHREAARIFGIVRRTVEKLHRVFYAPLDIVA